MKCSLCDGLGKVVPDAIVVLVVKGVKRPARHLKEIGECECWACKGKGTVELGSATAEPSPSPSPTPTVSFAEGLDDPSWVNPETGRPMVEKAWKEPPEPPGPPAATKPAQRPAATPPLDLLALARGEG